MARLRTLLIVLILLNLLAFAALNGWLGSAAPRGEPERLTNQLNPERIKLRPSSPAPRSDASRTKPPAPLAAAVAPVEPAAPATASEACLVFAGLSPEAARGLGDSLAAQADVRVRNVPIEVPSSWWVNMPPAESKEAAEVRVAELRKQGVTDLFIVQEPGPNQFAVSLGLFKQEAQAQRLVEQLRGKGVEARATPRGTITHRLEIRGPADRLAALASEVKARYPASSRTECQP